MNNIFSRTEMLLGTDKMNNLKSASVAVIGLGGVGSYAVEAIVRAGIGNVLIVDPDKIEKTNINRQLPALTSTVGYYKTDVIKNRLLDINPNLKITKMTTSLNQENYQEILSSHFDYVVDAIDSVVDKIQLIKYCVNRQIPIVSSMGAANRIDPTMFKIDDIKNTTTCPLAKKVRKELRAYGINEGVTVVYSTEQPIKTTYHDGTRLASISFVPGVAGLLLASVVIRKLIDN
ncbi:MAG TPA: tRNA threonylcarbamoyladenosine dehydratase [Syntrophomonadaceae bacterium]|nr:tRNA threonylcarbamoyladenosine dehydratase [Syntrophomonadaceae bacterium]